MGINMGHDRSVAVVENGTVVAAIEQERLDRIKHSVGFMLQSPDAMGQIQVPGESIAYCLDYLGLPLGEMSTITANMPGEDLAPKIIRVSFLLILLPRSGLFRVTTWHMPIQPFGPPGLKRLWYWLLTQVAPLLLGLMGGKQNLILFMKGVELS